MPQPTVVLVADYGIGDPSFLEVTLKLKSLLPEATILPQSVPTFSTITAGFWAQQIALTPHLANTFLYINTAPRREDDAAQTNNKGEKLMYARLKNGFEVMGVNAKYVFSFLKPSIEAFHFVNVENEGSQFRSRDKFPQAVTQMVQSEKSFIGELAKIELIPGYPPQVVASIDGYGNIKTTERLSEISLTHGQKIVISFKNISHEAHFADGIFNVPQGTVAFAPGSSGHDDKFMEIFYRGASAAELFGDVKAEDSFTIAPA